MEDGAVGHRLGSEDLEGLVPRLSGVDDERQVEFVRQTDLLGEHRSLFGGRRLVVVVVESALANGDDAGVGEEFPQALDALCRIVGMDAGCRPHAVMGPGDLDRGAGLCHVAADVDEARDTAGGRLGHEVCRQRVVAGGQMAVIVDPHRRQPRSDPVPQASHPRCVE